jgi:hypothetical protein
LDPGEQNQGGSVRIRIQIRIRNTVKKERKGALGLRSNQKRDSYVKRKEIRNYLERVSKMENLNILKYF